MFLLFLLMLLSIESDVNAQPKTELATFGNGCFWCTEAIFQRVKGVVRVESGYSGGQVKNPSYEQVTTGKTGHAEVLRIEFDPKVVSYETLLEVFWHTHDPTTLNRQGNDVGPQYRSAIFYHNNIQKTKAEASKKKTDRSGLWKDPIVTEISPLINYYPAEDYHQNYFNNNPNSGYCNYVIAPKLKKFMADFPELLK
jgi:peptide-methionine (S)-S-oxide reductase